MIYITVVYKVYRWETFLNKPSKEYEVRTFFSNWARSTDKFNDHVFLLIIDFTYVIKALVQLRLLPIIGPVYAIFKMLMAELVIFGVFFFMQ